MQTLPPYVSGWSGGRSVRGWTIFRAIFAVLMAVGMLAAPRFFFLDEAAYTDTEMSLGMLGGLAGGAWVITMLVGFVLLMIWVYRSNINCRKLGAADMQFSPGWAVGWWFIPIFVIFKPYEVLKEIWQASTPGAPVHDREMRRALLVPGWLSWVWIAFLVGKISGRIMDKVIDKGEEIGMTALIAVVAVTMLLELIECASLYFMLKQFDERQDERAEWLRQQQAHSPQQLLSGME